MSDLFSHFISLLILIMLNCANSIALRGAFIDAEEPGGQCIVFPIYYVRSFTIKQRTKKQQRNVDALLEKDHYKSLLLVDNAVLEKKVYPK